jgi:hypothetical protein
LFTDEDNTILIRLFDNQTKHHGPADLSLLAQLIQKDSKKIQTWFNKNIEKINYKLKCSKNKFGDIRQRSSLPDPRATLKQIL